MIEIQEERGERAKLSAEAQQLIRQKVERERSEWDRERANYRSHWKFLTEREKELKGKSRPSDWRPAKAQSCYLCGGRGIGDGGRVCSKCAGRGYLKA